MPDRSGAAASLGAGANLALCYMPCMWASDLSTARGNLYPHARVAPCAHHRLQEYHLQSPDVWFENAEVYYQVRQRGRAAGTDLWQRSGRKRQLPLQ